MWVKFWSTLVGARAILKIIRCVAEDIPVDTFIPMKDVGCI